MIKSFLFLPLIFVFTHAEISFKDIQTKPSGRAKNFMIWQYLKQDITPKEADAAYFLVEGDIAKIKKVYLKKSTNKALLREAKCRGRKDLLDIAQKDCFLLALSPYKTLGMDDKSRAVLISRIDSKSTRDSIKIQAEPFKEESYIKYAPNTILDMFIRTSAKHRGTHLNIPLSSSFLEYVFSKKASSWKKFAFIKIILNDDKLDVLQKSILNIKSNNIGSDSNFLLGLNHLKLDNPTKAMLHFKASRKSYNRTSSKDKNSFWMYKVTKKKEYLQDLALSMDINIYSLYGKEKLGVEVSNYFSSVESNASSHIQDLTNPFVWNDIYQEIKKTPKSELFALVKKYNHKEMSPVQSFVIEKAYRFKMHGYIMPYDKYLKDVSVDDKALIYALMRQESNLIPAALSRSFALGLMQLMPFVTDDLSKKMNNPIRSYDDMFKPEYNLKYALKHFTWLKKTYYHPLFVAYAYNGGLGYLRRHLATGTFTKGKYEPFLSMELMTNKESREYGKHVLANYIMYKKILGEEVSIVDLLSSLTDPMKTDRYRSSK